MKANRLTLLVSIFAIVLSVIAISISLPRTEMSFDYLGFITGVNHQYSVRWGK